MRGLPRGCGMREAFGDIWSMAAASPVPVVCVTTNLQVNSAGRAVMGGGIAREARDAFAGLDKEYGRNLANFRSTFYIGAWPNRFGLKFHLIMFPTKDHWRNNSIPALIEKSAQDLVGITDAVGFREVLLPRPGCGLGGLQWADVRQLIGPILDDRFVVVGFQQEAPAR